jgi:hypothetical protein
MKFNEVALALPPEDRGDLIARLSCQMAVRIRIQSARPVSNQFSFNTSTAARLRLLQKSECDLGFLAPPSGRVRCHFLGNSGPRSFGRFASRLALWRRGPIGAHLKAVIMLIASLHSSMMNRKKIRSF